MNRILNIMVTALAGLAFMSCHGNGGDALELTFKVDREKIAADGRTAATFSVYEGLENVTASAQIRNVTSGKLLGGNVFVSDVAGDYEFTAEYNGREAENRIVVKVEPVIESAFVRNVCLMEFTDATCTFCPDASRYLDKNILSKMDNVHLIAFHEQDEWKSSSFYTLFNKFKKDESDESIVYYEGTPSAVVDMRQGYRLDQGVREGVKTEITVSMNDYPSHCGVAVASVMDGTGKAEVTVRLTSEKSSDYYMAVYVVEDGIKGRQLDGSLSYDDYYHQYVERRLVSKTVFGDALGTVEASDEKAVRYSIEADPAWNLEKTYVYALALDADGHVNNMQTCLLDGGDSGYEYVNNQ